MTRSLADFLGEDFDRIGAAVLDRAAAIDGQRLVLSGATGFFGKSLLALLAYVHRRGARFEVSALSRDPQAFLAREPWAAALPWLRLHRGDARAPWPISGSHTLLIHAATDTRASAHVDGQAVFDDMLAATREALACAARCGVRRLLLTGSGAQYAAPAGKAAIDEEATACNPMQPGSAYGEAKRAGELLASLHSERHGGVVVGTRCFAFVGPGLPLDGHFAVGNFIADALEQRPIRLASAGLAQRSYLYGADLALWLLLLLLELQHSLAVNVGSDDGLTVRSLAERVRDRLAPGLPVVIPADAQAASPQPRLRYVPAIGRARSLGLEVWTSLNQAIDRTSAWHRNC